MDEAIDAFREAIRLKKDYAEAHRSLGIALVKKDRLNEAIDEYRAAIGLEKDCAISHHNLGDALARKEQWDEAIDEYRKAIGIKEDYAQAHYSLGIALRKNGQLDEAIVENLKAILFKKDYAEAHCNLGSILRSKGQFAEALVYYRRGHELGSKKPDWPYRSDQWVKDCERDLALDGKLTSILSGEKQPFDTAERLALANLCQMPCKKQYAAALRFYSEAFAAEPKLSDDLNTQHRYKAACTAALVGCGQGMDEGKLDAKERARLRQQALDWLRADLKAYRQLIQVAADNVRREIAKRMQQRLQNLDLACVRVPDALAKLPEVERKEWQNLWQEVETLRQRAAKPLEK